MRITQGLVLGVAMLALCGIARAEVVRSRSFAATSSGEHLWMVMPNPSGEKPAVMILHAGSRAEGPHYRMLTGMTAMPQGLASSGSNVWLVAAARAGDAAGPQAVYSIQALFNEGVGVYVPKPSDRLRTVSPLPSGVDLIDFDAMASGPVALISGGEGVPFGDVRLVALHGSEWRNVDVDEDVRLGRGSRLLISGSQGNVLGLLTPLNETTASWHRRDQDGTWHHGRVDLDLRELVGVTRVGGHALCVIRTSATLRRLAYLTAAGLADLAEIETPINGVSVFVGDGEGLRLVHRRPDLTITQRSIDTLRGTLGDEVPITIQKLPAWRIWLTLVFIAFTIGAFVLMLLVGPRGSREVLLPDGVRPLPAMRRLAALAIDLAPGIAAAMMLTDSSPRDLIQIPIFVTQLHEATGYLIMIIVAQGHRTLGEAIWKTSLGKAVVGGRVATTEGRRPGLGRVLTRAMITLYLLLIPPLGVFFLMNPNLQSPADVIARTVVVRRGTRRVVTVGDESTGA